MSQDAGNTVKAGLSRSEGGRRHQWSVLVVALAAALGAVVLPPLTIEQQFWIVLVPIGVFGLSHGGADPLILRRLAADRRGTVALMTTLYVLASLAFVALIWFLPTLALLVFLLLSIWHFGYTDASFLSAQPNALLLWLSGSLPILGPMLGHPAQTSELFAWLIVRDPEQVRSILELAGPVLAGVWLLGFGRLAYRYHHKLSSRVLAELILVAVALILLPPLLAFAFYFCVIHSIRHFLSVAQQGLGVGEVAATLAFLGRKAAPATLGAIGIAFGVWVVIVLLEPSTTLLVEAVRVMFWALAALTLPHGLVVKTWWESRLSAS
ncbi:MULTISPECIES: Brp/Blh family beta-carotene 15,15'-dioxygenase [Halomonadaceae]|uniref:Probable beta-carotene 15,15'-dioxygenase n=1 Tax=Vreelandella halophila TaxID=86177 RepID=A0A9X4Y7Y6_9GAMM|nr:MULTISPECIES: Brp/Blh family beta-carotene 15,15'-dioxygenase [Halomonas]MYL25327.1 beta-carotene 15,15'-dioxygenase, Brp/Blh family [Halomonas utahensis]MYL75200.1 beta-carotene 15,15'-dioxygenase, Brp/Blh family [Halomonas sp. 22501_18_FS]